MLENLRLAYHMGKHYRKSVDSSYLNQMAETGKRAGLSPKEVANWIMANEYLKGSLELEFISPSGKQAISEGLRRIVVDSKVSQKAGLMSEDEQREANYIERAYYQYATHLDMGEYIEPPSRQEPENFEPLPVPDTSIYA